MRLCVFFGLCLWSCALGKPAEDLDDFLAEIDCPSDGSENRIIVDELYCDLYYECHDGEILEHSCDDGLVYDKKTARCTYANKVDCRERTELQEPQPTEDCPRQNGYFSHPDPEICGVFYFCAGGVPTKVDCPPGLLFSPAKGECDWPAAANRVGCSTEDKSKPKCPEGGSPDGQFQHKRYADEEDCSSFFICVDGDMRKAGCTEAPELIFNPDSFVCDRQENVEDEKCSTWYSEEDLATLTHSVRKPVSG